MANYKQKLNLLTYNLQENFEKYEEANPDAKKKKRNKTVLTREERKLNDKLQGKPKKPPS